MSATVGGVPRRIDAARNDHALLTAAREVLAVHGAHASVAAIAARAGVGIGSLYRRYRTKEELLQHLSVLALDQWIHAAEEGLAHSDPWAGLTHFVTSSVRNWIGGLGSLAGTIAVTDEMTEKSRRGDDVAGKLVARAHAAGVLRPDATTLDVTALVVQLGRRDQLEPSEADLNARTRVVAIALDGLQTGQRSPLPGHPPGDELYSERWIQRRTIT